MHQCARPECQTTAGCAHRGPLGEMCHFPQTVPHQMGCICPPTSEQTCRNPFCPRGGSMPFKIT
jgi:hypothetical protein